MTGFMMLGLNRTQETLEDDASDNGTQRMKNYAPFRVTIILDVVFALSKGVPELDGLITRTRDDLTIVCTEADGEDVGGVADELTGSETSVQVPETQCVIPGRGKSELTIGGDDNVRNEMVMAVENPLGVSVRIVVASQLPDNDCFI